MKATTGKVRPTGGRFDEPRTDHRRPWWRKLDLLTPDGRTFLRRRGLDLRRGGGILVHRIDAPDPGIDLHDHPWWFVTIILRGGYTEEAAKVSRFRYPPNTWGSWLIDRVPEPSEDFPSPGVEAAMIASLRRNAGGTLPHERHARGIPDAVRRRTWRRWSIHRMPLTIAHRIVACEPNTVTLVIRGPKVRRWGFYLPTGWVDWEAYDYKGRRPLSVASNRGGESMDRVAR